MSVQKPPIWCVSLPPARERVVWATFLTTVSRCGFRHLGVHRARLERDGKTDNVAAMTFTEHGVPFEYATVDCVALSEPESYEHFLLGTAWKVFARRVETGGCGWVFFSRGAVPDGLLCLLPEGDQIDEAAIRAASACR